MPEEQLSDLAMLSIENKQAGELDISYLVTFCFFVHEKAG